MGRKNARILSQLPNKTAGLVSKSKRSSNISDRFSLSLGNTSSIITSGLLGKKKLVKTYSRHQPVQVTKKYHFLTPDTPEFDEMTQPGQKDVNSVKASKEETPKSKPPHPQEKKEILQTQKLQERGEGQRHAHDQGSDSSSSCTLVNVNNSFNQTKKPSKSNTSTASFVSAWVHKGRSGMVSDGSSLEIPRHADKETSLEFSKSSCLVRKKRKPNRTSYTVRSMSNCSSRIPRESKCSLSTLKSMTLCTPLGQADSPRRGDDDDVLFEDDMESLAEEEPKNSTWNESSMKLLFQEFLPESALSPIKGIREDSDKKNREIVKNTMISNDGKMRAARRCNEARKQTCSSPVQPTLRKAVQKGGSRHSRPVTSTLICSEEHPLFELDISAVGTQAKADTKPLAEEYHTQELLDYDPLPLQNIGTAVQTGEKDVTPETEEQKLRRVTAPRSVRRLQMRTSKVLDCIAESFALGKRKKAKMLVLRVPLRKTRSIVSTNSPGTIRIDSLIQI